METVKVFVTVFCTCAVMVGGMKLLLGGVLEESGKYILALILVVTTVGALTNINISLKGQKPEIFEKTDNNAEALILYETEYLIKELFNEEKVTYKKIDIKTNKTQDGSIVISEVIIYEAEPQTKAKALILENKIAPKVTVK
ncbi:MAG: hypothetical protein IJP21_04840 [Clostridia bacterium]|nr:hypothetical protein [Clostridia bacterium]